MSDQQRLNSLDRFRKRSPRLVLEEHDHCEVPAGCGGVVLRWNDPHLRVSFVLHQYAAAEGVTLWIDGETPKTTRIDLAPGPHVLALQMENAPLDGAILALVLQYDPLDGSRKRWPQEPHARDIVTAGDGAWRFQRGPQNPPTLWNGLDVVDADWPALTVADAPVLERGESGAYQLTECQRFGAACLGLPTPQAGKKGTLRIRRSFEVPRVP